jgi:hypothetical protein
LEKPAPAAAAKKPARKRRSPTKSVAAPVPVRLTEADVTAARATARHWDRTQRYSVNAYLVHAKFGVGYVTAITEQDYIVCLFEDGETRKLIHASA